MDRICKVSEKDGLPVVPGAEAVYAATDGHYVAYGEVVAAPAGAANGFTRRIVARLYRGAPGVYAVSADESVITALDKTALTFEQAALSPTCSVWNCKDEITAGAICIPSAMTLDETRPVQRLKAAAEQIGEE